MRRLPVRAALTAAAALLVVLLPPHPSGWPSAAHDLDRLAGLLAGAGLWLLAVWALVALLAGWLAVLPGAAGALGRFLVAACVPRVARGLVLGGVAGGLVLGPAVAASAAPVWPTTPAVASATPGPAWPTSPAAPGSGAPAAPSAPPSAPTAPAPPSAPPSAPTTPAPTTPAPSATSPTAVVVAPGDSLWSITAHALTARGTAPTDARIAAAWPAWYAANRMAIGPDPALLHPGTQLTAPTTDGSPR